MPDQELNEDLVARINIEHLVKTPLKRCDILFVFGTRDGVSERIDAAYRLWRDGYCEWLMISGGLTPGGDVSECQTIKSGLVSLGIPSERILEERRATNTGENVIFSLPIIHAALGLQNIKSVMCLGNLWTSRRYPMTVHRHWPAPEKLLHTVNHYPTPDAQWHKHPELRAKMLREWEKIAPYKAQGFITEWP